MEISSYLIKAKISDVEDFWWGFVIGILAAFLAVYQVLNPMVKDLAIQHGCGRFNPTDGRFEWISALKEYREIPLK